MQNMSSKQKVLSCDNGNNSNLKTHLKTNHGKEYAELKLDHETLKTGKLNENRNKLSQKLIRNEVLRFCIKEALPLSIVESANMLRLINGKQE